MKYIVIFLAILGIIGCTVPNEFGKIQQLNNDYNYCVNINNIGDSINPKNVMSANDSILLQFADGLNGDTLRLLTDKAEYKEFIYSADEIRGYSGYIKLSPETKELKLNFNSGPVITLSILAKRIFYIRKSNESIEILGLNKPAIFR
jgi:hypothetical protein